MFSSLQQAWEGGWGVGAAVDDPLPLPFRLQPSDQALQRIIDQEEQSYQLPGSVTSDDNCLYWTT